MITLLVIYLVLTIAVIALFWLIHWKDEHKPRK